MKSFAHKLLALTFAIALFTGCASVSDAGLDTIEKPDTEEVSPDQPDKPGFGTDQTMDPIVDEPEG